MNEYFEKSTNTKNTKLYIKAAALVLILVILGFGAYTLIKKDTNSTKFVEYVDPKLTDDQIQPFRDRIAEAQTKLSETTDEQEQYQLYTKIASEYYPIGELAKSREYYLKALKIRKDDPLTYYALAVISEAGSDRVNAEKYINQTLEITPENPDYWRFKIQLYQNWEEKTTEDISGTIDQALSATNRHVDILTLQARQKELQGDLEGAVVLWREAAEKNPADADLYNQEIEALQSRLQ